MIGITNCNVTLIINNNIQHIKDKRIHLPIIIPAIPMSPNICLETCPIKVSLIIILNNINIPNITIKAAVIPDNYHKDTIR